MPLLSMDYSVETETLIQNANKIKKKLPIIYRHILKTKT